MKRKTMRLKKLKRLSPLQKVEIRAAIQARRHLSTKMLARRYGVSTRTIYRIETIGLGEG